MLSIRDELLKRQQFYSSLENDIEKKLETAPCGSLRISNKDGRVQYYHRRVATERSGAYISAKERNLVSELAQKEYDNQLLRIIKKELKAIDYYLRVSPAQDLKEVYETLHGKRKEAVIPMIETDEMYLQRWLNMEFNKKGFEDGAPEFITDKGERVRSKSEMIIANLLTKLDVPYLYEVPVFLNGFGNVYTDFRVLDLRQRKEYYWEHLGMMDNSNYADRNVRKITAYELNGFFQGEKLILTYETKNDPLNMRHIQKIIEHYFL